ncbi:peptidase S [Marssonina coronariae]|uniref:Peptidase S n=1 Tax=Diplocarpon coronariae TaxID=2795749 RepID=A0A218Z9P7_9HELO|nr:peptidase S [Marssonina coronariae]
MQEQPDRLSTGHFNEHNVSPQIQTTSSSETIFTDLYLSAETDHKVLSWVEPTNESTASFEAPRTSLTFLSPPLEHEIEITGPLAAKLFASSSTTDMDLCVTLNALAADGEEAAMDGERNCLARNWMRASRRELVREGSGSHADEEIRLLNPEWVYELRVELGSARIVLPKGDRLELCIGGKNVVEDEEEGARNQGPPVGSRPFEMLEGRTMVHAGGITPSRLMLPLAKQS